MDAILQFVASIETWQWITAGVAGVALGGLYLWSTRSNETTRTNVRDD